MNQIAASICGIDIGDLHPARIMGVINLSPESFYSGSIANTKKNIETKTQEFVGEGAEFIDIGARSTAPGVMQISKEEEKKRLIPAIKVIKDISDLPISVDTQFSDLADCALSCGANIINDISGFKNDPNMVKVAKEYDCPTIIMATKKVAGDCLSVTETIEALKSSINLAKEEDIDENNLIIDPAIGKWIPKRSHIHDITLIHQLSEFRCFENPILVAISRKSFIGAILDLKSPQDRLIGSLSATAIAVYNGAHIVRTHDVAKTKEAISVVEAIKRESHE